MLRSIQYGLARVSTSQLAKRMNGAPTTDLKTWR